MFSVAFLRLPVQGAELLFTQSKEQLEYIKFKHLNCQAVWKSTSSQLTLTFDLALNARVGGSAHTGLRSARTQEYSL